MSTSMLKLAGKISRSTYIVPGGYFVSKFFMKKFQVECDSIKEKTTFSFNGMNFLIGLDTYLGFKMFWRGAHSWPPIFAMKNAINKGDVCVDVGANLGEYTVWMSKLTGKNGRVIAFEPISEIFNHLKQNIELNKSFSSNIESHQFGLGETQGIVPIFFSQEGENDANEGVGSIFRESSSDRLIEEISIENGDDFFKKSNLEKLDFIKIDVEGAELLVLRGLKNTLSTYKPKILIEINSDALARSETTSIDVARFLKELGYKLMLIKQRGRLKQLDEAELSKIKYANCVAIPIH